MGRKKKNIGKQNKREKMIDMIHDLMRNEKRNKKK